MSLDTFCSVIDFFTQHLYLFVHLLSRPVLLVQKATHLQHIRLITALQSSDLSSQSLYFHHLACFTCHSFCRLTDLFA